MGELGARSTDGFRAASGVAGANAEMVVDRCLAAENNEGVYAGDPASVATGFISVSNSMLERNTSDGIKSGLNGQVRAFGNTITRNGTGLNNSGGALRSGGHNFVDGNTTETSGSIVPIPTM